MPRRKQESSAEAPSAEDGISERRPKRACTQRHVPQIESQPAILPPSKLSFSDLLITRAWPAGYLGFGTGFSAADSRNSCVTLDGWKERTFKELIRRYARANLTLQKDASSKYGSAFVPYGSHTSKGRIYRFGSGLVATDDCRTMHRFPNTFEGPFKLTKVYSRGTVGAETVQLKTFTKAILYADQSIDYKPSFDDEFAGVNWKSPLNSSDLLFTTEATDHKESLIRIASLTTGKVLRYIWLSDSLSFKVCECQHDLSTFACGSSGKKGCVILFWGLHPFRYKGGLSISKAIFGKDITAADANEDILLVKHTNQKIRLYSLLPFTKQKLPKPVELGQPWDLTTYPHSTWFKLPDKPPGPNATYGERGSGMPITFFFTERPPVLYEVQADHDYFTLALKQHLVLVADKKFQELVLLNVCSGEKKTGRVPGLALKTGDSHGCHTIDVRNVVVSFSAPERLVIWNGQQLCFYGVQDADCTAKFKLKQDFAGISPDIKISRYTDQFLTCGLLSYSVSLNAVLAIFGLDQTRLLYIIDAVDGSVLSVTNLPDFNYSTSTEEVEVDECGLTYYREFANQPNCMMFYALLHLPSC